MTAIWTEGVCGDGVAILRDGELMAISDVLNALNDRERLVAALRKIVDEGRASVRRIELNKSQMR